MINVNFEKCLFGSAKWTLALRNNQILPLLFNKELLAAFA
jgi:hypothetical protein